LAAVVLVAGCSSVPVRRVGSIVGSTPVGTRGQKVVPQHEFTVSDVVHFMVTLTWDDVKRSAGVHAVTCNWYREGNLVSTWTSKPDLRHAPATVVSSHSALALGGGEFKVELLVDGAPVAHEEFTIRW
jgi:hypothetical protein